MTMGEWTVKFKVSDENFYMTIPAENAKQAQLIFTKWLFTDAGRRQGDDRVGSPWRALEGKTPGDEVVFRNDWVASYEVVQKRFYIT